MGEGWMIDAAKSDLVVMHECIDCSTKLTTASCSVSSAASARIVSFSRAIGAAATISILRKSHAAQQPPCLSKAPGVSDLCCNLAGLR